MELFAEEAWEFWSCRVVMLVYIAMPRLLSAWVCVRAEATVVVLAQVLRRPTAVRKCRAMYNRRGSNLTDAVLWSPHGC